MIFLYKEMRISRFKLETTKIQRLNQSHTKNSVVVFYDFNATQLSKNSCFESWYDYINMKKNWKILNLNINWKSIKKGLNL